MRSDLVINGFPVQAGYEDREVSGIFIPLLHRLLKLQQEGGKRLVCFLAGPPGSGKSTFVSFLQSLAGKEGISLQSAGLDGFHYKNTYLKSHEAIRDGKSVPLSSVKGSPETFDTELFEKKVRELKKGSAVLFPVYDRRIHESEDSALRIDADIVMIEGNWLLYDESPWKEMSALADFRVFMDADPSLLKGRLMERKIRGGMSPEDASAWYEKTDGRNSFLVLSSRVPCDFCLRLTENGF